MGLQEDIDRKIKEQLDLQKVKEKKWKFPWGKRVGRSQKKKNYVTVLNVHENGHYDFKKYQITDQTVMHSLVPRLATAEHVLFDKKGNPMIILPDWSVEPFSPKQHFDKSMENGSNTKGFKVLLSRMESNKIEEKKGISKVVWWIIGLGLLGLIVYALVTGGGHSAAGVKP